MTSTIQESRKAGGKHTYGEAHNAHPFGTHGEASSRLLAPILHPLS